MIPKRNKYGELVFNNYPEFKPNLTPTEIFEMGSFGGTYWRPIYSSVLNKSLENHHHKKTKWNISQLFTKITEDKLSNIIYNKDINKYGVKCGSSLEDWEDKGWISDIDPYGWVEWYCYFYLGRRTNDDQRQIDRWLNFTGPKGRFKKNLINKIKNQNSEYNDYSISPVIRQSLQHWGYSLTEYDFNLTK